MLKTARSDSPTRARRTAITIPVLFGLATALGAGLTVQACTITTTDTGPSENQLVDQNPFVDSGTFNACNNCQATTCDPQWKTCESDPNCFAIYTCATAVGCDETCVTNCFNAKGTGTASPSAAQTEYIELTTCQSDAVCGNCAGTCGTNTATCTPIDSGITTPVDSGSTAPVDSGSTASCHTSTAESCTQCQADCCSTNVAQCSTGSACATYVACLGACTTSDCLTTCATSNPQGKSDSDALGACTTAQSCDTPNCVQQ